MKKNIVKSALIMSLVLTGCSQNHSQNIELETQIEETTLFTLDELNAFENSGFIVSNNGILVAYTGKNQPILDIPEGILGIGNSAFAYNNDIIEVILPNGITVIHEKAFYYCQNLSKVELPSSLHTIENSAFENCTKLLLFDIPVTVINMGKNTFPWLNSKTHLTEEEMNNYIDPTLCKTC